MVAAHPCIWLVYSHNWYTDPEGWLPRTLERSHNAYERKQFYGLDLIRFGQRYSSCE